jgi:hypothetical protein
MCPSLISVEEHISAKGTNQIVKTYKNNNDIRAKQVA